MRRVCRQIVLALVAMAAAQALPAVAQQATTVQPATTEVPSDAESAEAVKLPTKEEIEQRLAALPRSALDENQRKKAAEFYQTAIQSLAKIDEQVAEKAKRQRYIEKRDENIAKQKALLAAPVPELPLPESSELSVWEEDFAVREQALTEKREDRDWYQAEPRRRATRLTEIPQQLSELRAELAKIDEQLGAADGSLKELAEARLVALHSKAAEIKATIETLETEQKHYAFGLELIHLTRDRMAREVITWEKRLEQLRRQLNERRQREADQQAALAARAAQVKRPKALERLAEENEEIAKERQALVQTHTLAEEQLKSSEDLLLKISTEYKRSQQPVELGGLSEASGLLLRQRQEKLPSTSEFKRRKALRQSRITDAAIRSYLLDEQRSQLADIDEKMTQVLAEVPEAERTWVEHEVRELLQTQRQYLCDLIESYNSDQETLAKLDAAETNLIQTIDDYANFIAKRVFWIRSCTALQPAHLKPAFDALAWSMSPVNWGGALEALGQAGRRAPLQLAVFVLAFPVLMLAQRSSRRLLRRIGEQTARRDNTEFRLTIKALWLTLVIALPWPTLLLFVGWCLDSPLNEEFVRSLSGGAQFTACCLLLVELWRHVCRPKGLAEAHFDWPSSALMQLRRNLRLLGVLGTPLVLWGVGLDLQRQQIQWSESLGRVLFIATMLLLAFVLWRVLLAEAGPFRLMVERKPDNWLVPLHNLWCPLAAAAPVLLAVTAFAGYYYTALQLALRGVYTIALVLGVMVAGGLLQRWMLVNRRKLAREQARQRRAQTAVASAASAEGATPLVEQIDEGLDLAVASDQTQKLIRTFLVVTAGATAWYLWRDMLPAVEYLFDRPLSSAPEAATWADLLISLLVLAFTWISVRNVPGLLELAVLQHLPLDAGARYAVSSVTRYLLTTIGVIVAASKMGIIWGDIQWLVAAMSVGLGFGLQDIFANFISGIILLFERPIRVGDVVTLGDKSGVVNRIRMRSTTIVDWDRKEYIVPNKDLVTERLLNWTLSDQINRIEIRVPVAQGTDTDLACALMLEAAHEQPDVMADPAPHAVFDGFGEGTLSLVMRCYLPTLDKRLQTIHALHTTVDHKFRAAGISFPNRDLWLRGVAEGSALQVVGKTDAGRAAALRSA